MYIFLVTLPLASYFACISSNKITMLCSDWPSYVTEQRTIRSREHVS